MEELRAIERERQLAEMRGSLETVVGAVAPFGEALVKLAEGDIEGAIVAAAKEGLIMVGTAGVGYGAYKAFKAYKSARKYSDTVENARKKIGDFLGGDVKIKYNKARDPIYVNSTNTRRVRFDVKNSHGDKPYGHIEIKKGNRWKDATDEHRIYLKDE